MIKDPTKLATTIAAPATEIAIAVAVAVATTSTTAITAVTIKAVTIAIQGEGASPSLSLYSVGEKGVKLKRRRKTRISTKKIKGSTWVRCWRGMPKWLGHWCSSKEGKKISNPTGNLIHFQVIWVGETSRSCEEGEDNTQHRHRWGHLPRTAASLLQLQLFLLLLVIVPWKSCRLLFKQQLLIARTQLLQKKRSNVKCYI